MSEIIVVHGPPGSGKSTQSERLAYNGLKDKDILHVSAGKRVRDVRAGRAASEFSDSIRDPSAPSPTSDAVLRGLVFELINHQGDDTLALVDGYPRHEDTVGSFLDAIERRRHRLLGSICLEVSSSASLQRILARGGRNGERVIGSTLEEFAARRYQAYQQHMKALGAKALVERIDADQPFETVGTAFRHAVSRLTDEVC